jgi:hypothetical protein
LFFRVLALCYGFGVFLFGMWSFLMLHMTAYDSAAVLRLRCYFASVCMCRVHFLPHPQHGVMQILVDVNVALHRLHISLHMPLQLLC